MNTRTLVVLIVIVVVVVVGMTVFKKPAEQPVAEPASEVVEQQTEQAPATESLLETVSQNAVEPVAEADVTLEVEAAAPAMEPEQAKTSPPTPDDSVTDKIVLRGQSFTVKSDMVFATVNNVDITLKDLMPINSAAPVEETVTATIFTVLLQRAIDREVVMQTARKRNMQLDDEQKRVVEKSRLRAAAQGFSLPDNERQAHEDKSNFESLDLMGTLMIDRLATLSGGPNKEKVTEEEYQKYTRSMLDELRGKAGVSENVVVE